MSTTDQAIDSVLGEVIAELQAGNPEASAVLDRLVALRTELRSGRGDDVIGLADPIEALAKALQRADSIINRKMTPPVWEFIDQPIRDAWCDRARQIVSEE